MAVEVSMTLKNAQALAAWEAQVAAEKKSEDQLRKNSKAYKDVAKEVDNLTKELREEQQLTEKIEQDQRRNAIAEVARLRAQREEMQKNTQTARQLADARFKAAQAAGHSQASGFGLNNPLMPPHLRGGRGNPMAPFSVTQAMAAGATGKVPPIAAAQAAANQGVAQTSQAAAGGLSGLARELFGFMTVTTAVSQAISNAKEMMRFGAEQREKGGSSLKSDFDVYREISEVSGPGEAAGRASKYKQLRAMGLDTGTAWGLLEKGIATGNEGSVDRFARTQGAMDPAVAMRVGSHLETLFKGEVNEVEGANMALEASRKSRWTVAQFAPSLPTAASGGSIGGSSAAETLAIQSVMSDVFSSPEQASDYLRYAGVRGARMDGLKSKGKGVMAMMEELGGMPMDDRRRAEFAGERVEFNTFIDKVNENKDRIAQRTREIEEAQRRAMGSNSNLEVGQREFLTIQGGPELLKNRAALQQEEGAYRDEFGVQQLDVESTRANMRRRAIKRGQLLPKRWVENKVAGGMEEAGFGAGSIELGAPAVTRGALSVASPTLGLLNSIYEALMGIKSSNDKMAEQQPVKPPPDTGRRRR